jgi:transcriptional regulator with XRE-family HTH domain
MTQGQIANALGISRFSWQKYEYGIRTPTRPGLREKIKDLLGIPVDAWVKPKITRNRKKKIA